MARTITSSTARKLAPQGKVFAFPEPGCPYCGKRMLAQITGWQQAGDGTWQASQVDVACENPKCQDCAQNRDTQDVYQPLMDSMLLSINAKYTFRP
jgi:hypothetical protein